MSRDHIEVRVRVSGIEVAKWLASNGQPDVIRGMVITGSHAPIYRHLNDDLGLPTMGAAEIDFALPPPLLDDTDSADAAAIVIAATAAVNEATDGLVSRSESVSVEVERR